MPLPAWLKTLATIGDATLRLARRVPILDEALYRIGQVLLNPIVVRLVRRPPDADLDAALELYQRRIPDDQRFESADIVRWLRDDYVNRRRQPGRPTDWFVVAKYRRQVRGFILLHYYPKYLLAFVAYMVVAKAPGPLPNSVSNALCEKVIRLLKTRKELAPCKGFVLEVEDPRKATSRDKQDESTARVRRFFTLAEMQGFTMRALDIGYRQPKLSLSDPAGSERPMLLMFASAAPGEVKRPQVEQLLTFVYVDLYPEGYSPDPGETQAYFDYCAALRESAFANLSASIRTLSCGDLVSQVRSSRKRRVRRPAPVVDEAARVIHEA